MTDIAPPSLSSSSAASHPAPEPELGPESFWAVVVRRGRYVVAILVSALLFSTLGWHSAMPKAEFGGVSLLAWQNHGLIDALILALMLLAATAVSSLLVYPDAPHIGLFCALVGMASLAIRGGTIHLLIEDSQQHGIYALRSQLLAIECVQWALIFLIAEVFARIVHDHFFSNTHWITRSAPDLAQARRREKICPGVGAAMGVSLVVSRTLRTNKMRRRVATPLAMIYSGIIAAVLLYVLMQSQLKGQVLMACFAAFFLSTMLAYLAFPRVPAVALLLAVPLTAAIGYLYGMHAPAPIPGHAGFFAMRALPIDYISAGVPGAILGFYAGFRWSLHSQEQN